MPSFRLRNVTLRFPIYHGNSRSLRRALIGGSWNRNLDARGAKVPISAVALNDLTLDILAGDRVAVMGANGAGKTSLLKVLAGIYEPEEGQIEISGQTRALLTPGMGLDTEATGRENINILGMYMNMRSGDMAKYIDEIREWTELGPYLEAPVRTYSAGMKVRLSFAVFTCIAPQCLLLDEWLSAGDAKFVEKAHERLQRFARESDIMVVASHSIPFLEKFCNQAILLEMGTIRVTGTVAEVAEVYRNILATTP